MQVHPCAGVTKNLRNLPELTATAPRGAHTCTGDYASAAGGSGTLINRQCAMSSPSRGAGLVWLAQIVNLDHTDPDPVRLTGEDDGVSTRR